MVFDRPIHSSSACVVYASGVLQPASRPQTDRSRLKAQFAAAECQNLSVRPEIDGLVACVFEDDVGLDAVTILEDAEESVLLVAGRLAHHAVEMPGDERLEAEVRTDSRAVAFGRRMRAEIR